MCVFTFCNTNRYAAFPVPSVSSFGWLVGWFAVLFKAKRVMNGKSDFFFFVGG